MLNLIHTFHQSATGTELVLLLCPPLLNSRIWSCSCSRMLLVIKRSCWTTTGRPLLVWGRSTWTWIWTRTWMMEIRSLTTRCQNLKRPTAGEGPVTRHRRGRRWVAERRGWDWVGIKAMGRAFVVCWLCLCVAGGQSRQAAGRVQQGHRVRTPPPQQEHHQYQSTVTTGTVSNSADKVQNYTSEPLPTPT